MSKKIVFCFFFIISFVLFSVSAFAINISAKGAVLLEENSLDRVLEKNADLKMPMASTTKIMTALVVLENARLDDTVVISEGMTNVEGSSIYLHEGEELTVEELLYAVLLESANDACVALAIHTAGDIEGFACLMNKKAEEMGLTSTHFVNPHGLDDEEHYTTPYELGIIAVNAMKNPDFSRIVSTYKRIIPLNNGEGSRVLINHNRLLKSYDGAIGIKTGFTKRCGRCLVSCALRDGVTLVCVTLNAPNDWAEHKEMLDYGFSQYKCVTLAEPQSYTVRLNTLNGEKSTFLAQNSQGLRATLKKDIINISVILEANRLISAPVKRGECVGQLAFFNNGTKIGSVPLFATEEIKPIKYKKSIFERIFG